MEEEPHFLVNDFLMKDLGDLKGVLKAVQERTTVQAERVVFFHNFTNELFKAYVSIKKKNEEEKQRLKRELEKKKQELIKKLEEMKQQDGFSQNSLGIKRIIKEDALKEAPAFGMKELVFSKITKKALAFSKIREGTYVVTEPVLTDKENNLLTSLSRKASKDQLMDLDSIKKSINEESKNFSLDYSDTLADKMRYYLIRNNIRFGKVSPLLEDEEIKEVVCEGAGKQVKVTHETEGELKTNILFQNPPELNKFIVNLALLAGNALSNEHPFLNASFDGFEIQATLGSEFLAPKFVIVRT